MRNNVSFIRGRIAANLQESGTDIVLEWDTVTGGTFDAVTRTTVGGTLTRETATIKGFIHYVQIAKQGVARFNEFEQGDCIIDVAPDAALDGKANLRFTIDDARWVAKDLGVAVPASWDVLAQGQRLYRSVLLRKAT